MVKQSFLSQSLISGTGTAVVDIRINADAAAGSKNSGNFNILRIHQPDEVFHNDVDTILVKSTVIAKTEQIDL